MKKIYYNITRIDNGWLISLPKYYSETSLQAGTSELMFPSLDAVLAYISEHYQGMLFDNELGTTTENAADAIDAAKNSL